MTTDEGRELLGNIQGPIAARLIAISLARFAAGGSTNHINFSAIFSPDLPFSRQPAGNGRATAIPLCIRLANGLPGMVAFMMLVPGSGQRWKTAFKTPMIASGGTANELHG